MTPVELVLACAAALAALGIIGVGMGRFRRWHYVTYGGSGVICTALAIVAALYLLTSGLHAGPPDSIELPVGLPWLAARFSIDPLASAFLLIVGLGGALASVYGMGYARHDESRTRVQPLFPFFLAMMTLVLVAADAFSFLFCWELMSLSSWALVLAQHRDPESARAGHLYLVMAGFGTVALLLTFGLLAGADSSYAFEDMRRADLGAALAGIAFCLALVGAGSKAGIVPLHAWLPLAHPAAPSHVSALLSGVMTKVAVYAFVRIAFDLLGEPEPWWSMIVLALGGLTAVLGVLYALMQRDLKRLLAFSTVDNVGVVFIGLGLALAFDAHGMEAPAALALVAAIFHAFNHSLFKSLLFFAAGAATSAAGERDIERLGGLIHRMPWTALAFLVGAAAISALPPLNGFASEWLTLQAVLASPDLPHWGLKLLVPTVGAALALAAALAAACFVRAFGTAFLGRPRGAATARATEVDGWSRLAMGILVVCCVLAGVFPGFVIDALAPIAERLLGTAMPAQSGFTIVPITDTRSSYNGLALLAFMVAGSILVALFIHRFASRALRRAPAWDCGYPDASAITQYTGTSFAQPIRRVFGTLVFAARERVEMPAPGDLRPARIEVRLVDPAWRIVYAPIALAIDRATDRLAVIESLSIRQYLGLVFLTLVGLLLVLAVLP